MLIFRVNHWEKYQTLYQVNSTSLDMNYLQSAFYTCGVCGIYVKGGEVRVEKDL